MHLLRLQKQHHLRNALIAIAGELDSDDILIEDQTFDTRFARGDRQVT